MNLKLIPTLITAATLFVSPLCFALDNSELKIWQDAVAQEFNHTVEMRHYLHANGELGNQEYQTQKYIADFLKAQGIEVTLGTQDAPTAVIGVLNPKKGHAIGLRADIDALPIKERNDLPYASKAKGKMFGQEVDVSHMCGHDAHMAMLLSAAKIMAEHKNLIDRTVVLVFQPAEEGDSLENTFTAENPKLSGAKALVENGLIEKYQIEKMFGIHVMARAPSGQILISEGSALNSADGVFIDVIGTQSHGAMPWAGSDAIYAASSIVVALQQIVSRNANLSSGMGVITIGKLTGGEAANVMAGQASMMGTIRSNDAKIRETLLKRIPEVANNTAKACNTEAKTRIVEIYPVTVNNKELAHEAVANLQEAKLNAQISNWNPGASEDFSFYTQKVPSVFMFLGIDKEGVKDAANNHSDKFLIDDSALSSGVMAHIIAATYTN